MKLWLFFTFFFSITVLADASNRAPRKYALTIGGGGDLTSPGFEGTVFDGEVPSTIEKLKAAGWEVDALWDGSHPTSTEKVAAALGKPVESVASFTTNSFSKKVDAIIAQVNNGQLKENDEVFLHIATHGAPPTGKGTAHIVSTEEGDNLDLNEKDMKRLRSALEKRNIKFAIFDSSCYGGASLDLATPKTCVLAGTTRNNVGDSQFTQMLRDQITSGRSLENSYLAARLGETSRLPQISSPAGRHILEWFNPLEQFSVGQYSYFLPARCTETANCRLPQPAVSKLMATMDKVIPKFFLGELKTAISSYQAKRKEIEGLQKAAQAKGNRMVTVSGKLGKYQISWLTLATSNYERQLNVNKAAKLSKKPEDMKFCRDGFCHRNIDRATAAIDFEKKLRETNTEYRNFVFKGANILMHPEAELGDEIGAVIKAERQVYEFLYEYYSDLENVKGTPNPCATFTF